MEKQEYKIMYEIENDYWWYRGLHELVLGVLKKFLPSAEAVILDAGCGTGRMLELLVGYKNREGLDYSLDAVEFCRQRGLVGVAQADLNQWEPVAEKYDGIISLDVLYHSAIADDQKVIEKFWQALKPGGILILNLPAFNLLKRKHDEAVWTKKRYLKGDLIKNLRAAGFKIELASYRLPWLFFVMLLTKIKEALFREKGAESDLKPMPKAINNIFLAINRLDNKMILKGVSWPWGGSVFVVARKS